MRTTVLAFSAVLLGVLPRTGAAQARESTTAHLRNDCRLAVQVLTTGQPANRRAWALERIDLCDASGPTVLAQLWSRVLPTRPALEELSVPSARLRDQRIYSALSTSARNGNEPDLKRVVALDVLSSYAAPNRGMWLDDLLDPRPDSARAIRTTSVDHSPRNTGAEPLPATITDGVAHLLRDVSEAEPTSTVGVAARRLLRFVLGWSQAN
jgi:hypothetical protein